jgi:hypothetical protein
MSWTGESTVRELGFEERALEEHAMDDLLDNLEGELGSDSSPIFEPIDVSRWDLSDQDLTPPPERWHDSVATGRERAITEQDASAAERAAASFDEKRTAVWAPSPELRARASRLIGQPVAIPTPPAIPIARRTASGTRPPSAPIAGQLVYPAEPPRAVLPSPSRNHEHGFVPVSLQPGRVLAPAKNLAKGSLIPMSQRALRIDQPFKRPPPPTAMMRLPIEKPSLVGRLFSWFGRLFGRRG